MSSKVNRIKKAFLDGKTHLTAELKHDYVEKDWSNVSEENMTSGINLRYMLNDQTSVRVGTSRNTWFFIF